MEPTKTGVPSSGTKNNNGGSAANRVQDASSELERQGAELKERLIQFGDRIGQTIRERPGTSILVALGVGYIVGRIVRS